MHTIQLNYQTVPNHVPFYLTLVQLFMSMKECLWDEAKAQLYGIIISGIFSAGYLTDQSI